MRGFLLPAEALLSPCQPHPWAEAARSDTGTGHQQRSADALHRGGTELTPLAVPGEMCTFLGGSRYQGRYRGCGAAPGQWPLAVLPSCIGAQGASRCQQEKPAAKVLNCWWDFTRARESGCAPWPSAGKTSLQHSHLA